LNKGKTDDGFERKELRKWLMVRQINLKKIVEKKD
jgi:hypothetical protein